MARGPHPPEFMGIPIRVGAEGWMLETRLTNIVTETEMRQRQELKEARAALSAALVRAEKAEAERDRLRGAILMVRDGKYPMGGPIQRYRPDGVPSPHDRCVYGTVHAKHDCSACAQGVLNAALDPTLRTMEDIWDALDPRRENRGPALAADQGEA